MLIIKPDGLRVRVRLSCHVMAVIQNKLAVTSRGVSKILTVQDNLRAVIKSIHSMYGT